MMCISGSEWWKWFDNKENSTHVPEKKVQYGPENIFFIKDVEINSRMQINNELHQEMQIIHTDKSDFIDNIPKFGGCNWKLYIGKHVIADIDKRYSYYWLRFIKVLKELSPTDIQEELPQNNERKE